MTARSIPERAAAAKLEFPYRIKHVIEVYGGATNLSLILESTPTKIYEWTYRTKDGSVRLPSGHSLMCLAILGVDLNWLFTGKGQPPRPSNNGHKE